MGLSANSDNINSTELETVKDSAVRVLESNITDERMENLQEDELNFGIRDGLHMDFNPLIKDEPILTQNEIIDQQISVMNEIQSNLSSVFENSTLDTRNETGELNAQQNIENLIQILERQKWQ